MFHCCRNTVYLSTVYISVFITRNFPSPFSFSHNGNGQTIYLKLLFSDIFEAQMQSVVQMNTIYFDYIGIRSMQLLPIQLRFLSERKNIRLIKWYRIGRKKRTFYFFSDFYLTTLDVRTSWRIGEREIIRLRRGWIKEVRLEE